MGKEKELTPEQIEGQKQYEADRKASIERVLAKEQERKQAELDIRKSKKRGTKKA